jgi:hypothetical protein
MEITKAIKTVAMNIKAERNGFGGIKTTTLMGKPGIGKTEMTRAMAKELKMNFYHVSAPEVSIEQLTGLPEFNEVPSGFNKYSVSNVENAKGTMWSCPEIVATANLKAQPTVVDGVELRGCVLLLDDIHETPLSTIPYFYQLLNEKKVSGWALDEDVHIVCAMNDSDSANFSGLPSPIINRMSLLSAEFDSKTWLEGYGVRFNYLIRSFLKANSQFLNEEENTEAGFGTPRSWTQFNNSFEFMFKEDKEFVIEHLKEIASGSVSDKAAMELAKHVTYLEKLNLNKYVEKKEIINVSEMEALDQVLLGYIVNFIDTIEDGVYLGELLENNIDNKSFVGFCASEVYLKYRHMINDNQELPLGLKLFIEKGLGIVNGGGTFDIKSYGKLSAEEIKMVEKFKLKDQEKFFEAVLPYIQP